MHRAYVQGVAMHGALECRVAMHGTSLHQVAVDYRSSGAVLCAGVTAVPSDNAAEGKHQHVSIQDVGGSRLARRHSPDIVCPWVEACIAWEYLTLREARMSRS